MNVARATSIWTSRHPRSTLALAVLACLVPFLAKPFNMDDPLFIWAARHITSQPRNPYGFEVNWYGTVTPMWEVTKNPPLACYYLALAGKAFGWDEIALRGACLLPALAVILGAYRLARQLCKHPLLAALLVLFTPVFLVSSNTVMCDVLMLAFWVWAVVLWAEGLQANSIGRLAAAGLLVSLAELTKYYGVCLIPLLAVYAQVKIRRPGLWSLFLLMPVIVLIAYHFTTQALYGRTLLSDAASYAKLPPGLYPIISSKLGGCLSALTFTGGCLAICAFFAFFVLWGRALIWVAGITLAFAGLLLSTGMFLKDYGPLQGTSRFLIEAQLVFWAFGGASLLGLAASDVWQHRDADSWLLGLWVLGTFGFAALFNWTVNGRSILPMAPAVAVLVVRRLDRAGELRPPGMTAWSTPLCFASGAVLAFLVARADFLFATSIRDSARQTFAKYGKGNDRFWFQGHWGFQYYMEQLGASALDEARTPLKRGDIIAQPVNNTNFSPFKPELVLLRELLVAQGAGPGWLATMKGEVGAGFYAAIRGPLPFAFGNVPAELVAICALEPQGQPAQHP